MMDAQAMFWMTFSSLGLLSNKQPSTNIVSETEPRKVWYSSCRLKFEQNINILVLSKYNTAQIFILHNYSAFASGWMPYGELGWHVWSCRQTYANISRTTEIEDGEEGNTTLTVIIYLRMIIYNFPLAILSEVGKKLEIKEYFCPWSSKTYHSSYL